MLLSVTVFDFIVTAQHGVGSWFIAMLEAGSTLKSVLMD
jgi:hypothetical protein